MDKIVNKLLGKHALSAYKAQLAFQDVVDRWRSKLQPHPVTKVNIPIASKYIAILILYQRNLRSDSKRLIEALLFRNVSVVVVMTTKPSKRTTDYLKKCNIVISTISYGRDFAGYKYAISYVRRTVNMNDISRIVLINDSVYVSSSGLEHMLDRLLGSEKSFVAATENIEMEYHAGSFAVSFGSVVLHEEKFWKYWDNYRPTNIRPRIIKKGEMKLSQTILSVLGNDIEIIYDSYKLNEALRSALARNENIWEYFRYDAHVQWKTVSLVEIKNNAEQLVPKVTKSFRTIRNNNKLSERIIQEPERKADDADFVRTIERYIPDSLVTGSQIHQNAILLRKYLNNPLVKNDLFYRGVLCAADTYKLVNLFPAEEREEILRLQFLRTPGYLLPKRKRLLFDNGYI